MFTNLRNRNHGECVYNLVEHPSMHPPAPPMYRSRFHCMVRQEDYNSKIGCTRTMGPPKVGLCPPQNYLKKNSRAPIAIRPPAVPKVRMVCPKPKAEESGQGDTQECQDPCAAETGTGNDSCNQEVEQTPCAPCVPCIEPTPRLCCNIKKPPIPPYCQPFGIIPRGPKDFVRDNAVKVVRQPAKIAEARYVDDPKGTRQDWCPSGYPRKYVCRSDYGEVPEYICERKQELLQKEQELACHMKQPQFDAVNACRHMTEEERCNLIVSLKNTWYDTYKSFQALPLMIDTPGKIKRKSELEEAMNSLEKDIQLVERHNNIFLADTDRSFYLA